MKRMHIHVGVDDIPTSIAFYSALFGAGPTVSEDDYAKWMLEDPRLNFAISTGHCEATGVEHVGIQVDTPDELLQMRNRLQNADAVATIEEGETHCCYAKSEKTWAIDPQNVVWETFHSMEQATTYGKRPTL